MCLPGQSPPFPCASSLAGVACSRQTAQGGSDVGAGAPTSLCTSALLQHAEGSQQPPRRPGSAQPAPQDWTQLQNGASGRRQSAQVNAGHRGCLSDYPWSLPWVRLQLSAAPRTWSGTLFAGGSPKCLHPAARGREFAPARKGRLYLGGEKGPLVSLSGHGSPASSPLSLRDRPFSVGCVAYCLQAGDWSLSMSSRIPRTDLGCGRLATIVCTSSFTARPPVPPHG